MKIAILQVADTGPLESLVVMLRTAGYDCAIPDNDLKNVLRKIGCNLVYDIQGLVDGMGYDPPFPIPEAGVADMERRDVLYVDVKAHRDYETIVRRWPHLAGKVLWYRINGGKMEHVIKPDGEDCGDEVNPPCPVLTPNQWYQGHDRSYTCWPPFVRFNDYQDRIDGTTTGYLPPVCLIHNFAGWGYGAMEGPARAMGIRIYGRGSPDGLVKHATVPMLLRHSRCMVHFKSSDAPGYAIYEAMAAGCPVVCTRRLIWRCRMRDLLIPGETCLVFDRETHDGLSEADVRHCTEELKEHIQALKDQACNRRIGQAGRERLAEIMWRPDRDLPSLHEFMTRNFSV